MEARLYVGNLSRSTTREKLSGLFAQAGQVTASDHTLKVSMAKPREQRGTTSPIVEAQKRQTRELALDDQTL